MDQDNRRGGRPSDKKPKPTTKAVTNRPTETQVGTKRSHQPKDQDPTTTY